MPRVDEVGSSQSPFASAIGDGLQIIDESAEVTFQLYTRVILPLDGYIFWSPTVQVKVSGSLHYSQQMVQNEDETLGLAAVTFSCTDQVAEFARVGTDQLAVATHGQFRYAFSQQGGFYEPTSEWHYAGQSIYPALASQLLDDPTSIDPNQAIVSNSLPLWLALNNWSTPFSDWYSNTGGAASITPFPLPIFPSFLVTPNLVPPYVAVHIGDEDTRALQPVPWVDQNRSSWQLCADRVRVTLFGLQNDAAKDFQAMLLQYMEYSGNLGLMSAITVRDAKRTQVELKAIAMKKTMDLEVSYNQARVASVARTLIESASASYQLNKVA
jgi:hypothetical protein